MPCDFASLLFFDTPPAAHCVDFPRAVSPHPGKPSQSHLHLASSKCIGEPFYVSLLVSFCYFHLCSLPCSPSVVPVPSPAVCHINPRSPMTSSTNTMPLHRVNTPGILCGTSRLLLTVSMPRAPFLYYPFFTIDYIRYIYIYI